MRLDTFIKGDNVLLLGEGNFSFAVCLRKLNLPIQITATCFEQEITYDQQQENIDYLESHKVPCFLDVDATKVHKHEHVAERNYSKIIFNFPHVGGKMKIQLNRDLLKDTFVSARKLLTSDGQMIVSLCRGQGGTPADDPQRKWDDSWQVAEMAAYGDLILVAVEPFEPEFFTDYKNIGYRSQDVEFHTAGALVHKFRKSKPPFKAIDETTAMSRLNLTDVVTNFGVIRMPVLYSELYHNNPINSNKSPAHFFQNQFLMNVKTEKVKILTEQDIALHTESSRGVTCKLNGYPEDYRLRASPIQIFEKLLLLWEEINEDELIFYPGVYFHAISGKNFMTEPPATVQFLLLGKTAATTNYRYISKLTKVFNTTNIACRLRAQCDITGETLLPKEAVEALNASTNAFKGKLATEWAYIYLDDLKKDQVVSHVYSLQYKHHSIDACIIYPDILSNVLFETTTWRELWSDGNEIITKHIDTVEVPSLRQLLLYPLSYSFDITLKTAKRKDLNQDGVYEILWLAAGQLINEVELLNKYESREQWSSYCFRVTYKSLDKPLYRKRVIDIQNLVVAKMLSAALHVTIS